VRNIAQWGRTHGFRTYISEPGRGEQPWIDQEEARSAVYGNRRRIQSDRGNIDQKWQWRAQGRNSGSLSCDAEA
jgi:hypothetical protein